MTYTVYNASRLGRAVYMEPVEYHTESLQFHTMDLCAAIWCLSISCKYSPLEIMLPGETTPII